MDKSPDAFRTISEVADELDLPQHVLRFWEGRFAQIKPLKRGGGRRYYRPDDVELLKGIRHLLYGEGYTIRGVQRILKEQGVRFVMAVWQDGAPQPGRGLHRDDDADLAYDDAADLPPFEDDEAPEPIPAHRPVRAEAPRRESPPHDVDDRVPGASAASIAQRFAPRIADDLRESAPTRRASQTSPTRAPEPRPESYDDDASDDHAGRSTLGALIDRFRGTPGRPHEGIAPAEPPRLSREDIRHLQSTLFELLECKRLLDQAR